MNDGIHNGGGEGSGRMNHKPSHEPVKITGFLDEILDQYASLASVNGFKHGMPLAAQGLL